MRWQVLAIPPFLLIIWGVIYLFSFYFWWGRGCSLIDLIKLFCSFKKFWIKVLSYSQMNYIVKTQGQPPDLQLSAVMKVTFTLRKILKVPGNARYCYLKALYLCTCSNLLVFTSKDFCSLLTPKENYKNTEQELHRIKRRKIASLDDLKHVSVLKIS